jgi:hypothetical protein
VDALPGWYPKSELRTRTVSPAACLDTIWNLKRVGVRAVITRVKRRRFVGQRDNNRARATRPSWRGRPALTEDAELADGPMSLQRREATEAVSLLVLAQAASARLPVEPQ